MAIANYEKKYNETQDIQNRIIPIKKIKINGVLEASSWWRILKFKRFNGIILLSLQGFTTGMVGGYIQYNLFRVTNVAGVCSIKELEETHQYSTKAITKARLVYKSNSENFIYLELYTPRVYEKLEIDISILSSERVSDTVSQNDTGEIPDGYTSKEIEL